MDKYNLTTLRKYLPEVEDRYDLDSRDNVWDAKRIVREYVKLSYLIKDEKSFENIVYSNQIRLQRLASAIKALTKTEEKDTLAIIRSVFESNTNAKYLSMSVITFSAYKQIRKLLYEIMPEDKHVEYALRRHDENEGRSMLIDYLLRQRRLSYNLATSNSGVLCCSSEVSVGIYAFKNLYNPFIAYCDNIIDELIVLLLGKSLDGEYTTMELQEHYDYPKVTDNELLDWDIDNW